MKLAASFFLFLIISVPSFAFENKNFQEGIYYMQNGYQQSILELKDGDFNYWLWNDAGGGREPESGTYIFKDNEVVLTGSDKLFEKNWVYKYYKGKPSLWNHYAIAEFKKSHEMNPYGVLFYTNQSLKEIRSKTGL